MDSSELIDCQSCGKQCKPETILKHISGKKDCKKHYSEHEKEHEKLKEMSKIRYKNKYQIRHRSRTKESRSLENKTYYQQNRKQILDKSIAKYRNETCSKSKFYEEIQFGPIFPCICCMRCLSLSGVKLLTEKFQKFLEAFEMDSYIDLNGRKLLGNYYICHSCHQNLTKKKMPNLCHKNRLQLAEVPGCLQISSLANQLLAKSLIFYKFRPLKKTGMAKMNDRVINRL